MSPHLPTFVSARPANGCAASSPRTARPSESTSPFDRLMKRKTTVSTLLVRTYRCDSFVGYFPLYLVSYVPTLFCKLSLRGISTYLYLPTYQ